MGHTSDSLHTAPEYKNYREKFTIARELLAEGKDVPEQWKEAALQGMPLIQTLMEVHKKEGKLLTFDQTVQLRSSLS